MTTTFMPVRLHVSYSDEHGYADFYTSMGQTFTDRAKAIRWGFAELNHDDFRIATLVNGRLSAIGFEMRDFDPDEEGLPEIAANLGLEVAACS